MRLLRQSRVSQEKDRKENTISEGQRNTTLTRIAGGLRRVGLSSDEIRTALVRVNDLRCDPPLPEAEIEDISRSAEKWEPGGSESYFSTPNGLFWNKATRDLVVPIRLTNFDARIVADVVEDDGIDVRRSCELETKLFGETNRFIVSATDFSATTWPFPKLGSKAFVAAGAGVRDHIRAAIQQRSGANIDERLIFSHSGWRKFGDEYRFLHGNGAIGPEGLIEDVRVELPPSLAALKLPAPPMGEKLRSAIRSSLKLLNIAPKWITVPLQAGVYRAPLGGCDHSIQLAGETGVGKTELAAVEQQHYGSGFSARNLPGSWSSTSNANEVLAFIAKDALITIDDYCPVGTRGDLARYNRDADRLLRGQGNSSGRQRLRADSSLRNGKPPRGLILSTGEDVPRGKSLRARSLILELAPNSIDWDQMTRCQRAGREGLFAEAMAAYLQWLAPQYGSIKRKLPGLISKFRAQAERSQQHKRTAEIVANLWVGINYFLKFAVESGAISVSNRSMMKQAAWKALGVAAKKQNLQQAGEDPVRRFVELIGAAIATGRVQLGDLENGKSREGKTECVGWTDTEYVFLDPDLSFAAAQKLASEQGEFITISHKTLWKRMSERGVLAQSETGRNLVRKIIGGRRRSVLALPRAAIGCTDKERENRDSREDG